MAGIVTSAQERMSKNGSLFMIFKIEDYQGAMEMLIGGEDYIRFKNYLAGGAVPVHQRQGAEPLEAGRPV